MSAEATRLSAVKQILSDAEEVMESVTSARNDEFQTRSERWQESEKGEAHANRTSHLEDALSNIISALESLEAADE